MAEWVHYAAALRCLYISSFVWMIPLGSDAVICDSHGSFVLLSSLPPPLLRDLSREGYDAAADEWPSMDNAAADDSTALQLLQTHYQYQYHSMWPLMGCCGAFLLLHCSSEKQDTERTYYECTPHMKSRAVNRIHSVTLLKPVLFICRP